MRATPFSVAVIPYYRDPLGVYNGGVAQAVTLAQATGLRSALNYAKARGGKFVLHGYTHQYNAMRNPHTAVSGDDYEFWDIVNNRVVVKGRARLMVEIKRTPRRREAMSSSAASPRRS